MKQWYALYTRPNSEYRVISKLQQREIETYLPEVVLPQSKKIQQRVPFFPCYLFMKVDMEKVSQTQWQWTPGLRRIVAIGNKPTPVPQQTIDLIKDNLDKMNMNGGLPTQQFQPGDKVRIVKGPLSGMLAIFEKPTSSQERVQVLLDFFGRMNQIKIEPHKLEKTQNHKHTSKPGNRRGTRGRGRYIT